MLECALGRAAPAPGFETPEGVGSGSDGGAADDSGDAGPQGDEKAYAIVEADLAEGEDEVAVGGLIGKERGQGVEDGEAATGLREGVYEAGEVVVDIQGVSSVVGFELELGLLLGWGLVAVGEEARAIEGVFFGGEPGDGHFRPDRLLGERLSGGVGEGEGGGEGGFAAAGGPGEDGYAVFEEAWGVFFVRDFRDVPRVEEFWLGEGGGSAAVGAIGVEDCAHLCK